MQRAPIRPSNPLVIRMIDIGSGADAWGSGGLQRSMGPPDSSSEAILACSTATGAAAASGAVFPVSAYEVEVSIILGSSVDGVASVVRPDGCSGTGRGRVEATERPLNKTAASGSISRDKVLHRSNVIVFKFSDKVLGN